MCFYLHVSISLATFQVSSSQTHGVSGYGVGRYRTFSSSQKVLLDGTTLDHAFTKRSERARKKENLRRKKLFAYIMWTRHLFWPPTYSLNSLQSGLNIHLSQTHSETHLVYGHNNLGIGRSFLWNSVPSISRRWTSLLHHLFNYSIPFIYLYLSLGLSFLTN